MSVLVKLKAPLEHDGIKYDAGDQVTLPDEIANSLIPKRAWLLHRQPDTPPTPAPEAVIPPPPIVRAKKLEKASPISE